MNNIDESAKHEKIVVLNRFKAAFNGNTEYYGRYPCKNEVFPDGTPMVPWTEFNKPLNDQHWLQHLTGKGLGLGIVPLSNASESNFGAIDYDTKPNEADLKDLVDKVSLNALPLIVCRSKSGGAHLYLFTTEPVSATMMRARLKEYALLLGIYLNPDGRLVEIFPKQGTASRDSFGNWINLPYFEAKRTSRYACHPRTGAQLDLRSFLDLVDEYRISPDSLQVFTQASVSSDLHPESPPCMQILDKHGYASGSRNDGLLNLGLLFEKTYTDTWQQELRDYNLRKFNPPLSDREVNGIISSLERDFAGKRKYTYGCNKPPINSACNRESCKKMTYGIDSFGSPPSDVIEVLIKVNVDPPRWLAYVKGKPIDVTTDELMNPRAFRKRALESINELVVTGTAASWERMLKILLDNLKVIEAPEDAGVYGQFKTHVRRFMERRRMSDEGWDNVIRELPVEHEGFVFFKSDALMKFLIEKCKFREYKPNDVYNAIRRMDGQHFTGRVPGVKMTLNLWKLPVPSEDEEQNTPFEVQDFSNNGEF